MDLKIRKNTTSKRIGIFVKDSSVTTGIGLAGLAWNSAGLKWYYWREDAADVVGTAVTTVTATRGTWVSGGFKEKDATNMPGYYELGIPNAVLVSGAEWVKMVLFGAVNMMPVDIDIQLGNDWQKGNVITWAGNGADEFKTDLIETIDDAHKDKLIQFVSGTLIDQVKKVSTYNGTTKIIKTTASFTGTPANGDKFTLVNE